MATKLENSTDATKDAIRVISNNLIDVSKPPYNAGDTGDDTAIFNTALAALNQGESLLVPATKSYKINSQLTEPSVDDWKIEGVGGRAFIDLSDMPSGSGFIAMTKRGAGVANLFLSGTSTGTTIKAPTLNVSITDVGDGTYDVVLATSHKTAVGKEINIVGATPDALNGIYVVASTTDATHIAFTKATGAGNSTVHGLTSYYVADGLLVGDGVGLQAVSIESVRTKYLRAGFIFNNSHDSHKLFDMEGLANNIDVLWEGAHCSSQRFENLQCIYSEQSMVVNKAQTNIEFNGATFSAAPYLSVLQSKNVRINGQAVFGMTFRGGRFELHDDHNAGGFWDNLYIEGNNTTYPAEQVNIDKVYFTGSAENHIIYNGKVFGSNINNPTFNTTGNNADITTVNPENTQGITMSVGSKLKTGTEIVYDVGAALVDLNEPFKHEVPLLLNTNIAALSTGAYYVCNAAVTITHTLPAAIQGLKYSFSEISGSASIFAVLNPGNGTDFFRGVNPGALDTGGTIAEYNTSVSATSEAAGVSMTLDSGTTADTRVIIECIDEGIWDYTVLYGGVTFAAVYAAITGTATASIVELDIVTGGKTIIITLTDDTWIAAGSGPIGTSAISAAILAGITSAQSETNGFNAEISWTLTDLVRTSNTIATVTLPATAGYDIIEQETITVLITAAALTTSTTPIVAEPVFTITPE